MLELRIALRYLFSRKTHNAVNVISLISVGGVAVATLAIVVVLSVFNGFEKLTLDMLAQLDPELRVVSARASATIENADSIAESLSSHIEGVHAMPTLTEQALAIVGDQQQPIVMLGVPGDWVERSGVGKTIIDGVADLGADSPLDRAIISVGNAVNLQTHPADERLLRIYVPRRRGRINVANPLAAFRGDSLLVSAVYQTGNATFDADMVIIPLENARQLLDYYGNEATSIELWLEPTADVAKVKTAVESLLPDGFKVLTRVGQRQSALAMISVEKWITFAMLAFILLIASFNIVTTLCLLVLEKEGNMAIMEAMGATPKRLTHTFVIEGWLISLSGGIVGAIIGCALVLAQQWGGFVKLGGDPSQMIVTTYPVELRPTDVVIVMLLVAVTGLITSAITATFARRGASRR